MAWSDKFICLKKKKKSQLLLYQKKKKDLWLQWMNVDDEWASLQNDLNAWISSEQCRTLFHATVNILWKASICLIALYIKLVNVTMEKERQEQNKVVKLMSLKAFQKKFAMTHVARYPYLYQEKLMSLCFFPLAVVFCTSLQLTYPLGPRGATTTYSQVLCLCSVCFQIYTVQ